MDSSSSGNSSRQHSAENIQFPKIGHSKKDKRKPRVWGTNKSYSIDKGFDSVTEEPFEEKDNVLSILIVAGEQEVATTSSDDQ